MTSSFISYIHSLLMLLFLLVFAVRISLLFNFFSYDEHEDIRVVMVNDPFLDLSFFW